jgi:hypothetical protein
VAHIFQTEVSKISFRWEGRKEYGNKAPVIVKPKFDLKKGEAILNTRRTTKPFFKLKGISEK